MNPTKSSPKEADDVANNILKFVEETRQGNNSEHPPVLADIAYRRIDISNQEISYEQGGLEEDEVMLFGLSY